MHEPLHIQLLNQLSELNRIAETVLQLEERWKISTNDAKKINLVTEELFTNIVFYAYDDNKEHKIDILFENPESGCIRITLSDDGKPFNPLERSDNDDLSKPLEERQPGGLGLHLIKKIANHIMYLRKDEKNIIILTFKI